MIELKILSDSLSIKINNKKLSLIELEVLLINREEKLLLKKNLTIENLEVLKKKRED